MKRMNTRKLRAAARAGAMAALFAGALAWAPTAHAQEAAQAREAEIQRILANPGLPGVLRTQYNPDGSLKSFLVLGTAPINRALPQAYARRSAFRVAELEAQNAVVKFLKTKARDKMAYKQGTKLVIKGEAEGDEGPASSQLDAGYEEVTESEMASIASGFVSGLQQVGSAVNDGMAIALYGWQERTGLALRRVADLMDRKDQSGTGAGEEAVLRAEAEKRAAAQKRQADAQPGNAQQGNGQPGEAPRGNNRANKDRYSISDDAKDFL